MEIKLPKSPGDLRIRHFKAFKEWNEDEMGTMDKARFVAAFTGKHINAVLAIDNNDFNKIYSHVIRVLAKMKIEKEPPQVIVIGGKEFELINPHKTAAGWHMDWGELVKDNGFEKDPVRIACLFYHPKGHGYGEIDKHNNLIHSIADKYDLFRDEMPLSTFIEASAFFLFKSAKSTSLSMEKKIWEIRTKKFLKRIPYLRGKKSSTI